MTPTAQKQNGGILQLGIGRKFEKKLKKTLKIAGSVIAGIGLGTAVIGAAITLLGVPIGLKLVAIGLLMYMVGMQTLVLIGEIDPDKENFPKIFDDIKKEYDMKSRV